MIHNRQKFKYKNLEFSNPIIPTKNTMEEYASPSGTLDYKHLMIQKKDIPQNHFRFFENLHLSSLGMGTYLGKPTDEVDQLVIDATLQSLNNGINVIDTAINYRHQKAERAVGKALKQIGKNGFNRNQIFISTKNGYIPEDADRGLTSADYIEKVVLKNNLATRDDILNQNCTTIPYLRHQLTQSLNNLALSTIDLLYLHNVAESQKEILGDIKFYDMIKKCFLFLEEKIEENKIRFYGMATWTCFRVAEYSPSYVNLDRVNKLALEAAKEFDRKDSGFKFVMLPYNMAMQEAATLPNQDGKTFFEKASELSIGAFTAVPLMQGRLLRSKDIRDIQSQWNLNSPAHAALQFVRSFGMPLIAPLVGHKQPDHVNENLKLIKKSPKER